MRYLSIGLCLLLLSTPAYSQGRPPVQFKLIDKTRLASDLPDISRSFVLLESLRGASTGVLMLEPENPLASVVLFAGGDGKIFIHADGSIDKGNNFLVRSRQLFARQSLRTIVIQPPSDQPHFLEQRTTTWHMQDIAMLASYLKSLSDIPVWLVGTSRGTISVAAAAAKIPRHLDGVIFTAAVTESNNYDSVYSSDIEAINLPALIVQHKEDGCQVTAYDGAIGLKKNLKNSAKSELITFIVGDSGSDDCRPLSNHGFLGLEETVVQTIADWIKRTTPIQNQLEINPT